MDFSVFSPQHKHMNWSVVKEYHPVSLIRDPPLILLEVLGKQAHQKLTNLDVSMSFQTQQSQFSVFANIRSPGFFNVVPLNF